MQRPFTCGRDNVRRRPLNCIGFDAYSSVAFQATRVEVELQAQRLIQDNVCVNAVTFTFAYGFRITKLSSGFNVSESIVRHVIGR